MGSTGVEEPEEVVEAPEGKYLDPREHRKTLMKEITTASGHKYLLKKPGARTFTELFDVFGDTMKGRKPPKTEEEMEAFRKEISEQYTTEALAQISDIILAKVVIKPKIVMEFPGEDSDNMWIEELPPDDFVEILEQSLEWFGVSPDQIDLLFFRRD